MRIGLEEHAVIPFSVENGVFLNQDKILRTLLRMVARIAAKGRWGGRAGKGPWQAFSPQSGTTARLFCVDKMPVIPCPA